MTFSNATGEIIDIREYSITSTNGAIDPDQLTPIADRLDNSPTGNGDIDPVEHLAGHVAAWRPRGLQRGVHRRSGDTIGRRGIRPQPGRRLGAVDL